jgi:hypothetical protein
MLRRDGSSTGREDFLGMDCIFALISIYYRFAKETAQEGLRTT